MKKNYLIITLIVVSISLLSIEFMSRSADEYRVKQKKDSNYEAKLIEGNNKESESIKDKLDQFDEQKDKIIYLTFDDGPSDFVTENILDTLKENDAKATFFLIGSQIKGRECLVKRMYDEGHSIGLHTYTHDYNKVYSSNDAFMKEMLMTQEKIKEVTGVSPVIIRFPSGSKGHVNKELLEKIKNNNFKIYDWNVTLSDGLNPRTTSDKLYREAIKGVDIKSPVILLMHCANLNKPTCKILPEIIKFYKDKGYEFRVINESTPEYYHRIKK